MGTKQRWKRTAAGVISSVMMCASAGIIPQSTVVVTDLVAQAAASDFTKEDGAQWGRDRVAEGWNEDVDGAYGCQCVDLVQAYGTFLGVYVPSLNAYQYETWALPDGWTKTYGDPQPGDIFVMGATDDNPWGHTGMVTGVNGSQVTTAETNYWSDHYGNPNCREVTRDASRFTCFIHPNFNSQPIPPGPDPDSSIANGKYNIVNVGTGGYMNHGYGWRGEAKFFPAIAEPADGPPEQTFNVKCLGDNVYTVRSGYNDAIMNVWAGGPSDIGSNQYITFFESDDNNNTQRFYFAPVGNGEYVIENAQNRGLVLGIAVETYNRDYQMIKLQRYNEADANQRWRFESLDPPPATEPPTTEPPTEPPTTVPPTDPPTEPPTTVPPTDPPTEHTTAAPTTEAIPETPAPITTEAIPETPVPVVNRLYGDVSDDGNVDIMDVIQLNQYLLGSGSITNTGKKNADVNGDLILDTTDSLNILKLVVELYTQADFPLS